MTGCSNAAVRDGSAARNGKLFLREPIDPVSNSPVDYFEKIQFDSDAVIPKGADLSLAMLMITGKNLDFDVLSDFEAAHSPDQLSDYDAVFLLDGFRLNDDLVHAVTSFRDSGGGLFLGGLNGIYDENGNEDLSKLQALLGITSPVSMFSDEGRILGWRFGSDDTQPLLDGLTNAAADSFNIYYIPTFDYESEGYEVLADLVLQDDTATCGYRDKTIFWFSKLLVDNDPATGENYLLSFLRNVYEHYEIPCRSFPAYIMSYGTNYRFLLSSDEFEGDVTFNVSNLTGFNPGSTYVIFDNSRLEKMEETSEDDGHVTFNIALSPRSPRLIGLIEKMDHPFFLGGEWSVLISEQWEENTLSLRFKSFPGREAELVINMGGRPAGSVSLTGGDIIHQQVEGTDDVLRLRVSPAAEVFSVAIESE